MFKVDQIDHVELFVPDRREAARWYERTLGLAILPQHEDWAVDPHGPLMISSNNGGTMLALFQAEPRGARPTAGFHLVAFRVDGPNFLAFLEHVKTTPVHNDAGDQIHALTPKDHDKAFSVYFNDPWGNQLEVTTYAAGWVRERIQEP
ncbi:MAG TPA: VOC family protein [Thermoanaerobaculia bacterium]|jgi:catechol 2,3-dioxygenase-like lactoylglutathione lyase family enzyme|nr:VOC family protein [Thermoanaerobaculia bacterium]